MHCTLSLLLLCVSAAVSINYLGEGNCWQPNEKYVECGGCEGTCDAPIVNDCKKCKPARCECEAKNGFVRSRHGHCISIADCPGPDIYSEDPEHIDAKNAKVHKDEKRYFPSGKAKGLSKSPINANCDQLQAFLQKRYFPVSQNKMALSKFPQRRFFF